ncbi:MAG TPA: biotin/lipoyl-binding protein, partial [Planctomycetota bacterium]|nr:biotin/lipoyl-binding protein [Planctomycetota bacterium]
MMRPLGIALLVVLLLAGSAYAWLTGWVDQWMPSRADATVAAATGTIERHVVAVGRVEPVTEVTIGNKMPGRIKAVLVKEGDMVVAGQPLIRFEASEQEAQVLQSRARVATAQADVRRAQRALDLARARWTEAKSGPRSQEIEVARAEVQQASRRWENLELERIRFKRMLESALVSRSEYE